MGAQDSVHRSGSIEVLIKQQSGVFDAAFDLDELLGQLSPDYGCDV